VSRFFTMEPVSTDPYAAKRSFNCASWSSDRFRTNRVSNEDVSHDFSQTSQSALRLPVKSEKAISLDIASSQDSSVLECLDVFSLPALGALGHVELHGLALLQALETARLDCRKMHKNVFASLTANKAVAFGVVEPLYCSLFCHVVTVPFQIDFTLERFGGTEGRLLAVEARAAHDRFGLTHTGIVRDAGTISKAIRPFVALQFEISILDAEVEQDRGVMLTIA
jgi:hypothetical protein